MNSEGFVLKFVFAIDKLLLIQSFSSTAQELYEEGGGLPLAGVATSIIFVATKHVFCRDKSMLVATKVCLSHTFAATGRKKIQVTYLLPLTNNRGNSASLLLLEMR